MSWVVQSAAALRGLAPRVTAGSPGMPPPAHDSRLRARWGPRVRNVTASGARRRSGFTLLEVLIATVITALLLAGLYSLLGIYTGLYDVGQAKAEHAQLVRSVQKQLTEDLLGVSLGSAPGPPPARRGPPSSPVGSEDRSGILPADPGADDTADRDSSPGGRDTPSSGDRRSASQLSGDAGMSGSGALPNEASSRGTGPRSSSGSDSASPAQRRPGGHRADARTGRGRAGRSLRVRVHRRQRGCRDGLSADLRVGLRDGPASAVSCAGTATGLVHI